jgi:hypothetical protein
MPNLDLTEVNPEHAGLCKIPTFYSVRPRLVDTMRKREDLNGTVYSQPLRLGAQAGRAL